MSTIKNIKVKGEYFELEDNIARKSSFSGAYEDLIDSPIIPKNISQVADDIGLVKSTDIDTLKESYILPNINEANDKIKEVNGLLDTKIDKSYYINKYALSSSTESDFNPMVSDSLDGDTLSVNINGKSFQNIFYKGLFSGASYGSVTDNHFKLDGSVRYSRINVSAYNYAQSMISPNTTYTVIITNVNNQLLSGGRVGVDYTKTYCTVSELKSVDAGDNSTLMFTFTTTSATTATAQERYFWVQIAQEVAGEGGTYEADIFIVKGDITNTPIELLPTKSLNGIKSIADSGELKIKSRGKNLYNPCVGDADYYGIKLSVDESGLISITGTATQDMWIQFNPVFQTTTNERNPQDYLKLSKGTYTLKCHTSGSLSNGTCTFMLWNVANSANNFIIDLNKGQATKTIPDTIYNRSWIYIPKGAVLTNYKLKIQLEEGTTPSDYQSYIESTQSVTLSEPLRSLPNGVFDEINGDKLIRRVGKIVLNGSEEWSHNGTTDNGIRWFVQLWGYPEISVNPNIQKNFDMVLANVPFISYSKTASQGLTAVMNTDGSITFFGYSTTAIADSTAYKQYLAANPVEFYYELATPITTKIDPISVLSYKNITRFSIEDSMPTEMQVRYISNQNKVLSDLQISMAQQIIDIQEQIDKLTLS